MSTLVGLEALLHGVAHDFRTRRALEPGKGPFKMGVVLDDDLARDLLANAIARYVHHFEPGIRVAEVRVHTSLPSEGAENADGTVTGELQHIRLTLVDDLPATADLPLAEPVPDPKDTAAPRPGICLG